MTAPILTACAGFLIAVLWMDLMFDSQIRGGHDDEKLASIGAYYHRATTTSQPMGSLIAAVMIVALATLGTEAVRGHTPGWALGLSALLAADRSCSPCCVPCPPRSGWAGRAAPRPRGRAWPGRCSSTM